jgi:3-oxoacyl-[acyl-carrier protein] reductase
MKAHFTALVTGASGGIGRAITRRFIEDGMQVINVDRVPPREVLPDERYIEADLSDLTTTQTLLAHLAAEQPIAVLVNNVAAVRPGLVEEATVDDLQAVVALNLAVPLLCVQALLGGMKERGFGRIVSISSRAALGKERRSVYAATKAGLLGFTRTWALELAPHGITVNAVAPGPIETEMFKQVNPADSPATRRICEGIPVQRMGQPDDVAHAVASLVDRRAGFITGQTLYVCGGMTIASG